VRKITGLHRAVVVRLGRSAPFLHDLKAWIRTERGRFSRHTVVAEAMDDVLKCWDAFAHFVPRFCRRPQAGGYDGRNAEALREG